MCASLTICMNTYYELIDLNKIVYSRYFISYFIFICLLYSLTSIIYKKGISKVILLTINTVTTRLIRAASKGPFYETNKIKCCEQNDRLNGGVEIFKRVLLAIYFASAGSFIICKSIVHAISLII